MDRARGVVRSKGNELMDAMAYFALSGTECDIGAREHSPAYTQGGYGD